MGLETTLLQCKDKGAFLQAVSVAVLMLVIQGKQVGVRLCVMIVGIGGIGDYMSALITASHLGSVFKRFSKPQVIILLVFRLPMNEFTRVRRPVIHHDSVKCSVVFMTLGKPRLDMIVENSAESCWAPEG